uniref:TM2 domain containing 1 n=1 Tax=Cyprinus carpio TaxID=7962 RepID=A0A8C2PUI9_CYPCA
MALHWRRLLRFRSTTRPLIIFTFCLTVIHSLGNDVDNSTYCNFSLTVLMYVCKEPKIDDATQEPENCKDRLAWGGSALILQTETSRFKFYELADLSSQPCTVTGYDGRLCSMFLVNVWLTLCLLPGLLKFCTVGFCGIGSLVDFMLISMQIVGPSDGSDYIVDYYGARLTRLSITNETYRRTQLSP